MKHGDSTHHQGHARQVISLIDSSSSSEDDDDDEDIMEPSQKRPKNNLPSSDSKRSTTSKHQELSTSCSSLQVPHTIEREKEKDDKNDKATKKRRLNAENIITSSSTTSGCSSTTTSPPAPTTTTTSKPSTEATSSSSSTAFDTAARKDPSIRKETTKPVPISSNQVVDEDEKASKRRNYLSQQIRLQNEKNKEKKKEVISILKKGRYIATTDNDHSNDEVLNNKKSSCDKTNSSSSSKNAKNSNIKKQNKENNKKGSFTRLHSLQSLSRMVTRVHFSKKLTDVRYYVVDRERIELSNADQTNYQNTPHDNDNTPLHRNDNDADHDNICQEHSFTTESKQHEIHTEEMDKKLPSSITTTGQPTCEGEDKTKPPKVYSIDSMLFDTAVNGTVQEMVECLKNGASARGSNNRKPIEELKKVIKELESEKKLLYESISSSKKSATMSSTRAKNRDQLAAVHNRLHCLKRKYSVLKIFKEVEMAIDLSIQIYDFRTFQFSVYSLQDVTLSEEGQSITRNTDILFFKFYVSGIKQDKNSKPKVTVPIEEHSMTFGNYGSTPPKCNASYNRKTDFKYRKGMVTVKVCLMKCSAGFTDFDRSVQLAAWTLSLDDVNRDFTVDGPQLYSDEKLETKKWLSRYVSDAKLSINVSVVDQDRDYLKRKRQEYAKRLKDTLKSIDRFKRDTHDKTKNEPPLLDVNITYFGMTSLLHAAVSVYAMDIINDLHRFGIDTTTRSEEYGTAVDLAVDLCEKAKIRGDAKMVNGFQHIIDLLEKF